VSAAKRCQGAARFQREIGFVRQKCFTHGFPLDCSLFGCSVCLAISLLAKSRVSITGMIAAASSPQKSLVLRCFANDWGVKLDESVDWLSGLEHSLVMRSATINEIGHDFLKVLKWVETGEQVEITREGRTVAVISPTPRAIQHPNYTERLKRNFGDKVLPAEQSAEIRDFNRGDQ